MTGTSNQVPPKLENPTMKVYPLQSGHDDVVNWIIQQDENTERAINSNEALANQMGESRMTIQRYIRLTNLIPKLLDMVDEGKIAFTIAVELSYLTEEKQYELYEVMDME